MTQVKSTTKVSVLAVLMLSFQAQAIFDPSWERPIERAQLEILETRNGFDFVENLEVVVRKRDDSDMPTSFVVKYEEGMGEMLPAFKNVSKKFFIDPNSISQDSCGSLYYTASLTQEGEGDAPIERTSVTLVDHRSRTCDDVVLHLFELRMSKGSGFCGTSDAQLHAVGNPEALFSAYIK